MKSTKKTNKELLNEIKQLKAEVLSLEKSETKIKESEDLFSKIFNNSPISIALSSVKDLKLIDVNQSWLDLTGYTKDEVINKASIDLNLDENPDYNNKIINELRSKGRVKEFDYQLRKKTGEIADLLFSAEIIEFGSEQFILSMAQDISESKQAEIKLLESEEKYRTIFENVQDVFYEVEIDGTILEISPSIEIMTKGQYKSKDLIGESMYSFYSDPKLREALLDELKKNGSVTDFEITLKNRDGSQIPCAISSKVQLDTQGKFIKTIGSLRDISKRKQNEEALNKAKEKSEESEERYRGLINNLGAGVVVHAADTSVILNNSKACDLLGLSNEQIKGKKAIDSAWHFMDINDRKLPLDEYPVSVIKNTNKPITNHLAGVYRPESKDKVWLMVNGFPVFDNSGKLSEIIISFTEFTSQKNAEDELIKAKEKAEESEAKFRDAFESAGIGMCLVSLTGKFLKINNSLLQILGYSENEMFNMSFQQITHPDDLQTDLNLLNDTVEGKINNYKIVKRYYNKKGEIVFVNLNVSLVRNLQNEPLYFVSQIEDITKQLIYEQKLKESEESLQSTFDLSPSIIAKADLNIGCFIQVNNAITKILGYTIEEFTSKPFMEFVHPDDRQSTVDIATEQLKGNEVTFFENRYLCKDGSYKWMAWFGTKPDKNGIVTTIGSDISKRKQAEERLLQSTKLLETSQSIAKLGGWELDIASNNLFWTAETYRIHDTSPEEFNPSVDAGVGYFLPESRQIISEALKAAIDKGEGYDLELETLTTKGRLIFVRTTCEVISKEGRPIKLIGIFQDITQQKRAERELIRNKELLDETGKISKTGGWELDIQTMEAYFTKEAFEIHGLSTSAQPPGMDGIKFYAPEARPIVEKAIKKAIEEHEPYDLEVPFITAKGNHIWVRTMGRVEVKNNKAVRLYGVIRDITQRNKERQLLIDSEKRYKLLHNASFGGIAIHDKGIILECNLGLSEMTGYPYDELMGMNGFLLIAEEYRGEVSDKTKSGDEKAYEVIGLRKNGEKYPLQLEGRNVPYKGREVRTVEFRDITERKEYENEIKNNENRLDALLQLGQMNSDNPDEIYDFTLKKAVELTSSSIGFLGFTNEDNSVVSIYNWSGEAMKDCLVENYSSDFEVETAGIWGEVVRTGKPLLINDFNAPNPLKRGLPSGHLAMESYLSIPVISNNKIVAVAAVGNKKTDYSDSDIKQLTLLMDGMWNIIMKNKSDAELKMALDKATESDRLKSAFLATMSHELRTPLNAIIGFSDIIDDTMPVSDIIHYNKMVNDSGNHLLHIVEDLFDLTLIETGVIDVKKEDQNLYSLLQNVHQIIKSEQQKLKKGHLDLVQIIPSGSKNLVVYTDPSKLKQIFLNLLKNALKFTTTGSVNYGFKIDTKEGEKRLLFYVEDTGIGISEDNQKYIFNMFRQVGDTNTRKHDGVGIGLSICKKLVGVLDGEIWVESNIDKGSTFYFTIPYQEKENDASIDEAVSKEFKIRSKEFDTKTILVVEDEDSSYDFLEVILEMQGATVLRAENGEEAVRLSKENPAIDLVLMDINMPIMNGFVATKAIKKIKPNLPIIAQTAYAISGDKEKALEEGCDDYISKPIKKAELLEKIEKFLS